MGQVIIKLDSLLKSKGVSKNKICNTVICREHS